MPWGQAQGRKEDEKKTSKPHKGLSIFAVAGQTAQQHSSQRRSTRGKMGSSSRPLQPVAGRSTSRCYRFGPVGVTGPCGYTAPLQLLVSRASNWTSPIPPMPPLWFGGLLLKISVRESDKLDVLTSWNRQPRANHIYIYIYIFVSKGQVR